MSDQLTTRLAMLKQEFMTGQRRLQELEQQEVALREALLRLSGAIEVLDEIVAGQVPRGSTAPQPGEAISPILTRLPG